jgi:membrane associated rhomboid family serine protease
MTPPPPFTLLLLATNVLVSLIGFTRGTGPKRDAFVFVPHSVARGRNLIGLLLSHFSHVDGGHLFVNMLGLYFFGPVLEQGLGSGPFLTVYALSGALASTAVFFIRRKDPRFRVLGASGSIAGILFAAIVLRPDMNLFLLFIPIPVPAPVFALLYLVLSSYFMGRAGSRICHEAHIGGALTGLLLGAFFVPGGLSALMDRLAGFLP